MEKVISHIKRFWPEALAVALFAAIAFAYFLPADIDGRVLYQHDASAGRGMGQEINQYREKTGKTIRWTNSIFSGMPTYQLAPSYNSTTVMDKAIVLYHLGLPEYVWFVFAYLLGFYILLRAFDFRHALAVLGAVVWAFSSYFFIIIAAGHIWKVMALAYLPPMIAGVVMAFKGRYYWGLLLTAIFTGFEVRANHVQMTYYYLIILFFMALAWLWQAWREHQMARFWRGATMAVLGAVIGICLNLSNLYHTWQYSKESMRGKSELVKKNPTNQTSSGLDRDYITQWSYGVGETWTLLVPNARGGASVPMAYNQDAMKVANPEYYSVYQQIAQYWGDQPMTSGPVYVGAFVLMLFFLGCFIVRGPMKWALLAATVLSILLSWGRNFMPLTNFFIDYVPMYAKFRTVASILVVAEFTIPLLAMMGLRQALSDDGKLMKRPWPLVVSFVLTGGAALLMWMWPTLFSPDFISYMERMQMAQLPPDVVSSLQADIIKVRQAIMSQDAIRSFLIVLAGTALLALAMTRKMKSQWAVALMTVLCLLDMWTVNKRYLNDAMFQPKSVREEAQPMTAADQQILSDTTPDYRVFNVASNAFNENETSFYHKSIGGYHPAKLRRYQELADAFIMPEMGKLQEAIMAAQGDMTKVDGDSVCPVLNMLNTRYFILHLADGKPAALKNPYTFGNAWMVDKVHYVNNANEELSMMAKTPLRTEAVANKQFATTLGESQKQGSVATVKLTNYTPEQLTYEAQTTTGGVAVFSEVYYPGWTATVDGQPVELGRVNYVLRALKLSPGKHTVVLSFHPTSLSTTETVAYVATAFLLLLIIGGGVRAWRRSKTQV